jgi:hypothetical protein
MPTGACQSTQPETSNSKSETREKNVVMLGEYGTNTFPTKLNEALS